MSIKMKYLFSTLRSHQFEQYSLQWFILLYSRITKPFLLFREVVKYNKGKSTLELLHFIKIPSNVLKNVPFEQ